MGKFKKFISFFLILAVLSSFAAFTSSAAATASIGLSASSAAVGSRITVTVNFGGSNIGATEGTLTYNSAVLRYDGGTDTAGGGGSVHLSNYSRKTSYSISFSVISSGTSEIRLSGASVWNWDEELLGNPSASASFTTVSSGGQTGTPSQGGNNSQTGGSNTGGNNQTGGKKSSNALLKSLTVSAGKLTPKFSQNVFNYEITLENSVKTLLVTAVTADSAAKWTVEGSKDMKVGKNVRTVVVAAADGTVKKYTITATRLDEKGQAPTASEPAASQPQTVEETVDNRIKVTLGEQEYILSENLEEITPPSGFAADISRYNDREIPVFKSVSGIELAALAVDGQAPELYLYDKENISFLRTVAMPFMGRTFLFVGAIENDKTKDFSEKSAELNGQAVTVYSTGNDDIVRFYAINDQGELNLYEYDMKEGGMIRYYQPAEAKITKKSGLKTDKNLELYFKIAVLTAGILLATVIVLSVLLGVSAKKRKTEKTDYEAPYIDENERRF